MKFLLILLLLFCALSVGHSLRCYSCNTDKLLCPPKIVICPYVENPKFYKCVSITKNEHKFKGCFMEYKKKLQKALVYNHPFLKTVKKLHPHSTHSTCDTDLCNGSGKFSKKSQIVSAVAGVALVLFQLF